MKTQISIKNFVNLKKELCKRQNLSLIDTTSEKSGYPSNLEKAIIGFSNFEAAENFAKKYNLCTGLFHKRDGWHFWARISNSLYKPLEGPKGGKVLSIYEDTHSYTIGVNCFN